MLQGLGVDVAKEKKHNRQINNKINHLQDKIHRSKKDMRFYEIKWALAAVLKTPPRLEKKPERAT